MCVCREQASLTEQCYAASLLCVPTSHAVVPAALQQACEEIMFGGNCRLVFTFSRLTTAASVKIVAMLPLCDSGVLLLLVLALQTIKG